MPRFFNYDITAPAFLSRCTPAELNDVKELIDSDAFSIVITEYRRTHLDKLQPGESYRFDFPNPDQEDE